MSYWSRYIVSQPGTSCSSCTVKIRVGGNVWQDFPEWTERLCDVCAKERGAGA